jgi:hypothetical protein
VPAICGPTPELRAAKRVDHAARAEERQADVEREQPDEDRRSQQQRHQTDRPQPGGDHRDQQQGRRRRERDGAKPPAAGVQLPEPWDQGRQEPRTVVWEPEVAACEAGRRWRWVPTGERPVLALARQPPFGRSPPSWSARRFRRARAGWGQITGEHLHWRLGMPALPTGLPGSARTGRPESPPQLDKVTIDGRLRGSSDPSVECMAPFPPNSRRMTNRWTRGTALPTGRCPGIAQEG